MTPDEKRELDVKDFWRVHDGLETYAKLDAKGAMERLRGHKEDGFCEVTDYAGNGKLMCTRDGYDALIQIAERHRESLPIPDDYSLEELVDGMRTYIVRAMVNEKEDEAALARVLSDAVGEANKNHLVRTYHFPCVIVHSSEPPQFKIGAVVFTSAQAFPKVFDKELQAYIDNSKSEEGKTHAKERVKTFEDYLLKFGWLASVTVPACAEKVSKRRAEVAVSTAINLLRLVFGVHYGRDMRVAHLAFTQPSAVEFAVTNDGELDFVWSRKASGALVEKDWYLAVQKWQDFWVLAGRLIATTLLGKRSEISYRVEDALTWFGDSAFESAPGTQIVNFVAALERLTTTETFSTHKFCSRVAMLAYEKDEDFEKTYWNAFEVHSARSGVIHGGFSPASKEFRKTVRLAHDLTRNALFRGLEVHLHLDSAGNLSGLADLQKFFTKQHSKWASALKKLEGELKAKKKH
jgi:Apea-like HEPN